MATRIDGSGYLIDEAGRRLTEGNSEAERLARWQKVVDDWKKTHKNDEDGPPAGTTIMQVEKGDCQWTIAEGAGADPIKTYTQLNEQFDDPDLIDIGDIVFVDKTTHFAVNRDGEANVDLFRDQVAGRSTGPDISPGDKQALPADIRTYLESAGYQPEFIDTLVSPGDDKAWTAANSTGRQLILTDYFSRLKTDPMRQSEGNRIAGAPNSDPLLLSDVQTALGGPDKLPLPGSENTNIGWRVRTFKTDGTYDNGGVFILEFKQHADVAGSGQYYDMYGKTHPAPFPIDMGNGYTFNYTWQEWGNLEHRATKYFASTPLETRDAILKEMLADPEITGRARQTAISAYLRSFEDPGQRDAAKARLLNGADATLRTDVEQGYKLSQRRI
jgi:hypothetical protein